MSGPTKRDVPIWKKPVTKEKSMHTAFVGEKKDLTQSRWGRQGRGQRHENDEEQQEHWPIGF